MFQAKCRSLQRKPLTSPPRLHPSCRTGIGCDKNRNPGERRNMARDFRVLVLGGKGPAEHQRAQPVGQGEIALSCAEQPVAGGKGVARIEPQPVFQLGHESRVSYLSGVSSLPGNLRAAAAMDRFSAAQPNDANRW